MQNAIGLGKHRELFLDDYCIEWLDGLEREICPVSKHPLNPLVYSERDNDPAGFIFGSVIFDEEDRIYKAWLMGHGTRENGRAGKGPFKAEYYFTSPDGIQWERPDLGLFEGLPGNTIALCSGTGKKQRWPYCYEIFGVTKDNYEKDEFRRYKMGGLFLEKDYSGPHEDRFHPGQRRGLFIAFSPDGVHWNAEEEPVTYAIVDGLTGWFREKDKFVLYGRTKAHAPNMIARYGSDRFFKQQNWGRAVNRVESSDFVNWTPENGELVLTSDALDGPGAEIYGMSVFPYEGIYIGLVQMFHNYLSRVWLEIQIAVSRDTVHFQRLSDRSPFIPVGGVGAWDRFNHAPCITPPVRCDEELRFYYSGRNYVHSGGYEGADNGADAGLSCIAGLGLGSIKRDRFAALEGSFATGTMRSKPLSLAGEVGDSRGRQRQPNLHVNAEIPFGVLEAVFLEVNGDPIPGMTARVQERDSIDISIPMPGIEKLTDRPVRLELKVSNGRLYSFWVE